MSECVPAIGFLGFGEAAFEICKGLRSEGLEGIVAYDKAWNQAPYSKLIATRARQAGVKLLQSVREVVGTCALIFSAVTADAAVTVALDAAEHLTSSKVYIDINSASPMTKLRVATIVEATGARFVDVAVMAAVPEYGHKVPMLASGSGAQAFQSVMAKYGMVIKVLGDKAGLASAAKMFRSVFMKGYAALWLETLLAANAYDCSQIVLDSISESISKVQNLQKSVYNLLLRTGIHAQRRVAEMEEVLDTLRALGVRSEMSQSTASQLKWLSSLGLAEAFLREPPETLQALISFIGQRAGLRSQVGGLSW